MRGRTPTTPCSPSSTRPPRSPRLRCAHIPNVRMEAYGVYTDKHAGLHDARRRQFPAQPDPGVLVDLLAERLGMDPIDVVTRNFGHAGRTSPTTAWRRCCRQARSRIGWQEKRHAPGSGTDPDGGRKRGVGFSFHPGWHAEWQELRRGEVQVSLTLNPDGTVMLDAPTVETGTGSNTCNVLGCAEALGFLGIGPEDITWVAPRRHRAGPQGHRADRQLGLVPAVGGAGGRARSSSASCSLRWRGSQEPAPDALDIAGRAASSARRANGGKDLNQTVLWQGDLVRLTVTIEPAARR